MSAWIVSTACPGPRSRVRRRRSRITSPAGVTAPAAMVVPPTSTPSSSPPAVIARGLEVAEVAELQTEALRSGARRRGPEADELRLALAAVAAGGEGGGAPAGMAPELRDPRREGAGTGQRPPARPVGPGPRLAGEVVR